MAMLANGFGTGKARRWPLGSTVESGVRCWLALVLLLLAVVVLVLTAPAASAYVYWTSAPGMVNTIGRANLDGSGANASFISVGGGSDSLFGLAVDSAHAFWADQDPNAIGRANLNGSGANPT